MSEMRQPLTEPAEIAVVLAVAPLMRIDFTVAAAEIWMVPLPQEGADDARFMIVVDRLSPVRVIALLMESEAPEVPHVAVPAGTITTSPAEAELIAACTSASEVEAAVKAARLCQCMKMTSAKRAIHFPKIRAVVFIVPM